MTDKIIFLDIDGPVIPYRAMFLPKQSAPMEVFDPVAVSLLNHLCEENGWKIVLHTSWVQIFGGEYTHKHCINQGIHAGNFHADAWCDENINWRYTRVAKWLNEHPDVTKYAIVDDEPWQEEAMGDYPTGMQDHLILVNYYQGFMFSTYNDILAQAKPDV